MKAQKILIISLIAVLFIGFTSCEKDELKEPEPVTQETNKFIGVWRFTRSDGSYNQFTFISNIKGEMRQVDTAGAIAESEFTYEYTDDKIIITIGSDVYVNYYSINGDELVLGGHIYYKQ